MLIEKWIMMNQNDLMTIQIGQWPRPRRRALADTSSLTAKAQATARGPGSAWEHFNIPCHSPLGLTKDFRIFSVFLSTVVYFCQSFTVVDFSWPERVTSSEHDSDYDNLVAQI